MYSQIASRFDQTRAYVWPCVRSFLEKDGEHKTLLEAGCGNGKNIEYANRLGYCTRGYDQCPEFVEICKKKGLNVEEGDVLDELDILDKYDIILCIAVLHHLTSETDRLTALTNLYNQLEKGGKMLITLWSYEKTFGGKSSVINKTFEKGDNWVPWKTKEGHKVTDRYYYIYDYKCITELVKSFEKVTIDWEEQNWVIVIEK